MKITADTSVLVRAITEDDREQSTAAKRILAEAELVAIPLPVFCELAWVLARGYRATSAELVEVIGRLARSGSTRTNLAAVDAGLTFLEAGGDFADGVIAFEGALLGGQVFATFDKKAVALLEATNRPAVTPA